MSEWFVAKVTQFPSWGGHRKILAAVARLPSMQNLEYVPRGHLTPVEDEQRVGCFLPGEHLEAQFPSWGGRVEILAAVTPFPWMQVRTKVTQFPS